MTCLAMNQYSIRSDIRPGDIGRVVRLHGELYAREFGFNAEFEAYVAQTLGEFIASPEPAPGRLWLVELNNELVGCAGLVLLDEETGQLRWLAVHPDARGCGLGRRLVRIVVSAAEAAGCSSVVLWTVHPLTAARRLYESEGFQLDEEVAPRAMWGRELREQRYLRNAGASNDDQPR
jgi:N-acetylglutamate synthase-like GNAT family acetyltransferase